jgi:pimeloyl-ACP methyl ester carboxylesterase
MTTAAMREKRSVISIELSGVGISFLDEGNGRPLLFLDGACAFRPDGPFDKPLTDHFRTITPTLPGFDDAKLPGWMTSVDDIAHTLHPLLSALDLKNVVVVGCSIGGWVAAEMATLDCSRIRHLVLVSPFGVKVGSRDQLDIPDLFAMERGRIDNLLYGERTENRYDPSDKSDAELLRFAQNLETFALLSWDPYLHNPKLRHRLPKVEAKALVLRGANDGVVSKEYAMKYAELFTSADYIEITGAGHLAHIDQPSAFVQRILEFSQS